MALCRDDGKTHLTLLNAAVNSPLRFCVEEENEIALNVGDQVEIHTHYQAKYNLGMPSYTFIRGKMKCPKCRVSTRPKENFQNLIWLGFSRAIRT